MSLLAQYQSGNILYRLATKADSNDLKTLLRDNEMDGWISLSFEREPCFFKGTGLMGNSYTVIAHKADAPDKIIGMYLCEFLPVHINGKKEIIGYLAGLRVAKPYRNKIRYLKRGYDSITKLIPRQASLDCWFTSITTENYGARHLLEAGLKGLPTYTCIEQMSTLAISVRYAKKTAVLQKIDRQSIPEFVAFYNQQISPYQFSPVLTEQWLLTLDGEKGISLDDFYIIREYNKIIASLSLWDQRAYKQTVVKAYRPPLNRIRKLINFFTVLTRRVPLPIEGEKLDLVYLSFLAIDNDFNKYCVSIIQDILCKAKDKGAKGILIGLSDANPVLPIIKASFSSHIYKTSIETVSWSDKKSSKPGFHSKQIIQAQVQPEIAVL